MTAAATSLYAVFTESTCIACRGMGRHRRGKKAVHRWVDGGRWRRCEPCGGAGIFLSAQWVEAP